MNKVSDRREFFKVWGLAECRDTRQEEPAPHQAKALGLLNTWFQNRGRNGGAGILVLPTGGGKTFTAVRFLADGPLSDGYKVLWLAHTHHLLEQAFHCFRPARIGAIREPRRELRLRVVSGTPGHFPPRDMMIRRAADADYPLSAQRLRRAHATISPSPTSAVRRSK